MTSRPPDSRTDQDLLAGWRAGDRSMGSALYHRYADSIAGFFRRNVHDRDHVQDLTQDTFLALRESTADIENVTGYLFRIAFDVSLQRVVRAVHRGELRPAIGMP
jgi:DNA-directed RNA polymerase specialized sigma24 family protein